jgi:DNA modification methylase
VTVVLQGDCRAILPTLDAGSVHCVVTSPPYFGLRDYGTATWDGGDPECGHSPEQRGSRFATPVSAKQASNTGSGSISQRDCKCGARRIDAQLGLEPTPEEFVANMVAVFREVRRVLRDDGTVWLNLGDSFATGGHRAIGRLDQDRDIPRYGSVGGGAGRKTQRSGYTADFGGLKPKDLVGIPWRVAFALQADGWYLRSDIIWSKPNPMPESVTDRPTKSHEYVFMLSKRERYFFDQEAVREPHVGGSGWATSHADKPSRNGYGNGELAAHERFGEHPAGRNIRSVWTIATQPYPEAHFATFPEALVVPCIKAGTSERGVCAECGAPWERVVERPVAPPEVFTETAKPQDGFVTGYHVNGVIRGAGQKLQAWRDENPSTTTGWRPSCAHDAPTVPATVLDPFGGSGTVGAVAERLSRRAILIELSPEYVTLAERRTAQVGLGLVS